MTYLEIINNVLRRLREDTVVNPTESDYSIMAGDFINDAKRIIEDSYQWEALRTTYAFNTVASTSTYALTGINNRGKLISVYDTTSQRELQQRPQVWLRKQMLDNPTDTGAPQYYGFNGLNSAGDTQICLHDVPDGVYNIDVLAVAPQEDLINGSDIVKVPYAPVIHLALAMLARERGETGGTSAPEYFQMADKYLRDAIGLESARHEDELIYYTV